MPGTRQASTLEKGLTELEKIPIRLTYGTFRYAGFRLGGNDGENPWGTDAMQREYEREVLEASCQVIGKYRGTTICRLSFGSEIYSKKCP